MPCGLCGWIEYCLALYLRRKIDKRRLDISRFARVYRLSKAMVCRHIEILKKTGSRGRPPVFCISDYHLACT